MLIIWSALLGVLFFLGMVVVTLLFGVAANRAEKEIIERTEAERRLTAGASCSNAAASG
jgi:hypothetical protein